MNDMERLALAVRAAKQAGELLLSRSDLKVEQKAAHDYVTDMDRASERLIRDILLSACPEDGFFGEESGRLSKACEGEWIVDPIDGTTNFIKGLPSYTISIAYRRKGVLTLGVVHAPVLGEMYAARRGGGAQRNGHAISVSQTAMPIEAISGMSFSHRNREYALRMLELLPRLTNELNDMRRSGSAALDLCHVACGCLDAFFELGLNLYDIAAGIVILEEAGGKVTGWPDEEDVLVTGNIIATNGLLHPWFEEALRPVKP